MASQPGWHLGQTSQKYETGGRGAGVISTGRGDHGGVSYGSYQLSTNVGTLAEYLNRSVYKDQFDGLRPNTPAFNEKWVQLAARDPGFAKDQHAFIKETHYDIQQSRLTDAGLDLSARGPAVQDLVWSTSVQFRNLTPRIFVGGLKEKFGEDYKLESLTDRQIVEAAQDYKITHNNALFSKSPTLWNGLLSRARNEKTDLVQLAEQGVQINDHNSNHLGSDAARSQANGLLRLGQQGEEIQALQRSLNTIGSTDTHGRMLAKDGDFGRNTEDAVRKFQRTNGLGVDGIAGPATLRVINQHIMERAKTEEHATSQVSMRSTLADPGNAGHALYKQAYDQIQAQGARQFGLVNDSEVLNAAGTLAFEAKVSGLQRIDHVVVNQDASGLLAVEGALSDPRQNRVYVDRAQAAAQTLDRSTQLFQQDTQRQTSTQENIDTQQQVRAAMQI